MHINDLLKIATSRRRPTCISSGSHPVLRVHGHLTPLSELNGMSQETPSPWRSAS